MRETVLKAHSVDTSSHGVMNSASLNFGTANY